MIYLIRHAKVQFIWDQRYSLNNYIKANNDYNLADIDLSDNNKVNELRSLVPKDFKLYTSTMKRSIETAKWIFPNKEIIKLEQLSEIPIEPYTKINKIHSLWKWFIFGRIKWIYNGKNLKRNKKKVEKEIKEVLKIMINDTNSVIIGHGFQFRIMINEMKRNYLVKKNSKYIKNLDVIICKRKKGPTTAST